MSLFQIHSKCLAVVPLRVDTGGWSWHRVGAQFNSLITGPGVGREVGAKRHQEINIWKYLYFELMCQLSLSLFLSFGEVGLLRILWATYFWFHCGQQMDHFLIPDSQVCSSWEL